MTRIVVADDHPIVREGLRSLFEREPDLRVVGEVASGLEVADAVERLAPELLVLDLMMPGLSGLEVVQQVAARVPSTRILVFSMQDDDAYAVEAIRQGATGYALKGSDSAEILRGVRDVVAGRRYLAPSFADKAAVAWALAPALPGIGADARDPCDPLTPREREVLNLAAEGLTHAEIGQRLGISPRTVEVHRGNFMKKLGLSSQTELVRFAVRRGLIAD